MTDLWAQLVGQDANVVVPSAFADYMDGLEGGAVLADLVWWQAKHGDWFWRTDALIAERQHVTLYAVKRARDKLTRAGLLSQRMAGQPAKAHYRLDLDRVLAVVTQAPRSRPTENTRSRPTENGKAGPHENGRSSPPESPPPIQLKGEVKGITTPPQPLAGAVSTAGAVGGVGLSITPVDLDDRTINGPTVQHVRKWDAFFQHVGDELALSPWQQRKPTDPQAWARDLAKLFGPVADNDPTTAARMFDQFIAWARTARYGSATRMTYLKASTVRDHAAAWIRETRHQAGETFEAYGPAPAVIQGLAARGGVDGLPF